MSSDEQYLEDPDERDDGVVATKSDRPEPTNVDEVRAQGDDPYYAPQNPGDIGYEPKAVTPELDLEGGTVFRIGEDEYGSMKEALESQADAGEGTDLDQSQDPARLEAAEDDTTVTTEE